MSANDQYIIREVGHDIYDLFHVDVDSYTEDAVVPLPLKTGIRSLIAAIRTAEKERTAEYGYVVEFLDE